MSGRRTAGSDAGSTDEGLGAALRLTTGVTVLTARADGRVHGSTVSAAGLVSRNPPVVAAGLRPDSALLELAYGSGRFAVNVLSGRQALLADWFADPERPLGAAQFEPLGWAPDPETGLPLLGHALAHLICRVSGRFTVGDHELLLGTVESGRHGSGTPLISFEGALHGAEFHEVPRRRGRRGVTGALAVALD
jgi:flavin reductase